MSTPHPTSLVDKIILCLRAGMVVCIGNSVRVSGCTVDKNGMRVGILSGTAKSIADKAQKLYQINNTKKVTNKWIKSSNAGSKKVPFLDPLHGLEKRFPLLDTPLWLHRLSF